MTYVCYVGVARSHHKHDLCANQCRRLILTVLQLHPSKVALKTFCVVQLFWVVEFQFSGV